MMFYCAFYSILLLKLHKGLTMCCKTNVWYFTVHSTVIYCLYSVIWSINTSANSEGFAPEVLNCRSSCLLSYQRTVSSEQPITWTWRRSGPWPTVFYWSEPTAWQWNAPLPPVSRSTFWMSMSSHPSAPP